MFEKIKKKREKNKIKPGRLRSLSIGEKAILAINIQVFMDGEDAIFRITTPGECEELHYDRIEFVALADDKKIKITARFKSADQEKKYVTYDFVIEKYNEFFA